MATYTGQSGVLKLDNAAGSLQTVGEVTSFSIEHTVNTVESTAMGDQYREFKTSVNEWTGSADVYLSSDDVTALGNVFVGNGAGVGTSEATLTLEAYPGGNTTGYPKLSGEVIVTGFSVTSEMEGMVTASLSFQGTGALTLGSAA